jgi:YfiH family protein
MKLTSISPDWPAAARVNAAATERGGGVSVGTYCGLNLGTHVGDEPAAVANNRRQLVDDLALPDKPSWLEQIHGAAVVDLDTIPAGAADAAVTSEVGRVCVVLTADCLPVLFSTTSGDRVGVAHAGWRGLAGGVLAATVAAMGADPRDLLAWLGPAIGPAAYEVGDDVRSAFLAVDPGAGSCFAANARGRWQADLYGLARRSLAESGVTAVYGGDFCTFTEAERFYSHRREAPCGRQATLIWLSP